TGIASAPTEIDPQAGLARRANVSLTLQDETDADVQQDPYVAGRATPAGGTFWSRLLARNPNYSGRWARVRRGYATDPWDCGYLAPQPATLQHLRHFRPRRATLLLAHELPATDLAACIATLNANCHDFHHPVRLLVLGSAAPGNPDVAPLDVDPVSARSPDRASGNGSASHYDDWQSITPRQETP
ncbi:MAG: hypothetical protein CVU28_13055, partial [Betaproteobacteria bacterium HGW-Betaproteobacteria-21]